MSDVFFWVVEEKNSETGKTSSLTFNSYDEALDYYNQLKQLNENNFVSIQRTKKKLLTEG